MWNSRRLVEVFLLGINITKSEHEKCQKILIMLCDFFSHYLLFHFIIAKIKAFFHSIHEVKIYLRIFVGCYGEDATDD